jgi:hypothetical protein
MHSYQYEVYILRKRKSEDSFAFLFIYKGKKNIMASSSSSKSPCATCGNKTVGVFKCEGCWQTFCRKHYNEHRYFLAHQLDEIILEHDTLRQMIVEQTGKQNDHHHFIQQINKWEKDSIMKIQQTAEETRQQVEKIVIAQNGNL